MNAQELAKLALTAKRSYVGTTDEEACAAVETLVRRIEELEKANTALSGRLSDASWQADMGAQQAYQDYGRSADGWLR